MSIAMAYGPCLNPSCQSHGQPHPHCKCYGAMASGGDVEGFCDANRAHQADCIYYMTSGGPVFSNDPRPKQANQRQEYYQVTGGMSPEAAAAQTAKDEANMAQGGAVPEGSQPKPFQGPKTPLITGLGNPAEDISAAIAHGGANMLFGSPKSAYYGAFGSDSSPSSKLMALHSDPVAAQAADYLTRINKGRKAIKAGVGELFGGKSFEHESPSLKETKAIADYISQGGANAELMAQAQPQQAQGFAEGGHVSMQVKQQDPLCGVFPEHSMMLNASKTGASNYLASLKPQELQIKQPFDANKSTKPQEREYKKAVSLAAKPLSILKHMKEGNLTPTTLRHFSSLYPELHDTLSKEMTKEVLKAQMAGTRPNYKIRQAMSLFMGAPLDSTMQPQNIMAAQNVFAQKVAQQQAPAKSKKGVDALAKANESYETANQAAETRQKQ